MRELLIEKFEEPSVTNSYDTMFWENRQGKIHRDNDLPAIIYADGGRQWYKNDMCHRGNDKHAAIWADGSKFWYKNGKLHRDNDKPAIIYANGEIQWYKNGMRHRDNYKTAIIRFGRKWMCFEYWKNDKCIRKEKLPLDKTLKRKYGF